MTAACTTAPCSIADQIATHEGALTSLDTDALIKTVQCMLTAAVAEAVAAFRLSSTTAALATQSLTGNKPGDERPTSSETGLAPLHKFFGFEPFVDADVAAEFIASKRKTILDWARDGSIPAHPFGRGKRTEWRFRLSEIAGHTRPIQGTISTGSPEMVRPEKRYG